MNAPFVRSPYNYDVNKASDEAGVDCSGDKGRTQQSFADDADINILVKRFGIGAVAAMNVPQVLQGDFESVVDFQSAMDLVVKARESFDAMPAVVRTRFDNDPGKFVAFTSDVKNFDEAVKFGLVRPEVLAARAAKAKSDRDAEIAALLKAAKEAPTAP